MSKVTKEQYEFARARVEELLPFVNGTPVTDKNSGVVACIGCCGGV